MSRLIIKVVNPTVRLRSGPLNYEHEAYRTCVLQGSWEAGKLGLADGSNMGEHLRDRHPLWRRLHFSMGGVLEVMYNYQNVTYLSVSASPNDGCTT